MKYIWTYHMIVTLRDQHGISNYQKLRSLFRLFRLSLKKHQASELLTLVEENPPPTSGLPTKFFSITESVSMSWRHLWHTHLGSIYEYDKIEMVNAAVLLPRKTKLISIHHAVMVSHKYNINHMWPIHSVYFRASDFYENVTHMNLLKKYLVIRLVNPNLSNEYLISHREVWHIYNWSSG